MRAGFLITGRLKSTRLPKKVILEVAGKPLFSHMCDRLKHARRIDDIVLCTSTNSLDDPLVKLAQGEGISYYRGSEEDVLERLCEATEHFNLDYVVNITADCPIVDPLFVDMIIDEYEKTHADLIRFTNLPPGQGPNGIKVKALKKVCELKDETETEVWGGYFTNADILHCHDAVVDGRYLCPGLKTTLDYPEDYEFLKQVFDELYVPGKVFSLREIIRLVKKKPELLAINSHCIERGKEHIRQTAAPVRFKSGELDISYRKN
jgi:spore coat polysaccharide biosynthesis protein SpsF